MFNKRTNRDEEARAQRKKFVGTINLPIGGTIKQDCIHENTIKALKRLCLSPVSPPEDINGVPGARRARRWDDAKFWDFSGEQVRAVQRQREEAIARKQRN